MIIHSTEKRQLPFALENIEYTEKTIRLVFSEQLTFILFMREANQIDSHEGNPLTGSELYNVPVEL